MTASMRVALGLLLVLALAGGASAAADNDLSGLSKREYEDYARDRFEWLTGERVDRHHWNLDFPVDENGDLLANYQEIERSCWWNCGTWPMPTPSGWTRRC